jgi:hypothetical protein
VHLGFDARQGDDEQHSGRNEQCCTHGVCVVLCRVQPRGVGEQ